MNAPARTEHLVEPKLELIPCASIAPSETHIQALRRKRYDLESLKDLAASIAKLGVQQPGVVRKLSALRGLASYEIVAGERRWRASRQADVAHFPAIVRELTDAEVLEIQLVENLQRETLHELEEAVGYEELMKVAKITGEQVADRVGKSRSWVYSRLNLLKLDGDARKALEDGRLDVSRALVVASVAQPNQRAEALRLALETGYQSNKPMYSVRELRHKIGVDRLTMPLAGAPFPMDDAKLLPDMGACGPCRFRTANCDPDALDPDVCTNLSCYHLKVKAQGERVRLDVLDAGGKVLRGEEARKISPSVKTVYGHIDLDHVAEGVDDFPEEAPTPPKDIQKEIDDADDPDAALENWPPYRAYLERERLWQPRTYRALLEGMKYTPVVIEDPKTKLVRQLLPFKEAQTLLKKKGLDLPSYYNRKRPTHQAQRSEPAPKAESAQSKAKREAEEQKRQLDQRVNDLTIERILAKIKTKHDGTVGIDELIYLSSATLNDELTVELEAIICRLFGVKKSGWDWAKVLGKLSAKDAGRLITVGLVAGAIANTGFRQQEEIGDAICKRFKIDRKAIEKEVRTELAKKAGGK
jgi:ParB/RepB/Spo0J family partition protein